MPLLTLPSELLSSIALELVALDETPGPPSCLLPLLLAHPRLAAALSFRNTHLYGQILHLTFDTAAIPRRFGPRAIETSQVAAQDLLDRWTCLRRIKRVGAGLEPFSEDDKQVEQDLLLAWLLLTESDGHRNLRHVLGWSDLPRYTARFQAARALPQALNAGLPEDSITKAIFLLLEGWFAELDVDMRDRCARLGLVPPPRPLNHVDQVEESLFLLRPHVFGLHKYPHFIAPWQHRNIPLDASSESSVAATPAVVDVVPRPRWVEISRFGKTWRISPPSTASASASALLNHLDEDPSLGGLSESSSNSSTKNLNYLYPYDDTRQPILYDAPSDTHLRRSVPVIQLPSSYHDNDIMRAMMCVDPTEGSSSRGVGVMSLRGKLEGAWQGSFGFLAFDGFRDMLAGNDASVYEATFGQQSQELILREKVVRVRRQVAGGTGPVLFAGYPDDPLPPDSFELCHSDEETEESEDSEWTKEILLEGTGRSAWGEFMVRGRVRAWDGLIYLVKYYESPGRGRWLHRLYLNQDSRLIGSWRDTFTAITAHGYEGPTHMRRQAECFLVPLVKQPPTIPAYSISSDPALATEREVRSTFDEALCKEQLASEISRIKAAVSPNPVPNLVLSQSAGTEATAVDHPFRKPTFVVPDPALDVLEGADGCLSVPLLDHNYGVTALLKLEHALSLPEP